MRRELYILSMVMLLITVVAVNGKYLMRFSENRIPNLFNPKSPSVYISTEENVCLNFEGPDHWIFVHSPEDNDLIYLSMDIEINGINSTAPLVIPATGVVLGEVNVSESPYHIEAAWTPRSLEHEPLIKLLYLYNPSIDAFPYNVVFQNSQGNTVPGTGLWTLSCCGDPGGCWVDIDIPDHVYVLIGEQTIIPFKWYWECWATGGGDLSASDTEGWVSSWAPSSAGGSPTFGLCIVPVFDGWIEVSVPEEVTAGTTSQLSIFGVGSATVTLEAEDKIPIEHKSWGAIKSLYWQQ